MANEIKDKFGASIGMAITLDALATSNIGVGRQATFVDNTTTRWQQVCIYYSIVQGTTPAGGKCVYFHLLRKDNNITPHIDDNANGIDASHTVVNAPYAGSPGVNKASPATGDKIMGSFIIDEPGDWWSLSVNHDTGVNLGTGSYIRYEGINPEIQ